MSRDDARERGGGDRNKINADKPNAVVNMIGLERASVAMLHFESG